MQKRRRKEVKKLKLLFDGQLLAKAFIQNQTGIFRASDEIFKRLARRPDIELSFLMTNRKGEPERYLSSIGRPDIPVVRMPLLLKTTKHRTFVHRTLYGLCRRALSLIYGPRLKKYDAYLSTYEAISPIAYKSPIKTGILVYDMILSMFPHFGAAYGRMAKNFDGHVKRIAADAAFFVSESARRDFLTFRPDFPFERTRVVHMGVSMAPAGKSAVAAARARYAIGPGRYALALSESNPRKNFPHIIKSFSRYLEISGDKETKLVIGGKKLPGNDYANLAEKTGGRVVLTGYVAEDDLAALYAGASLFLYPSLYEGFGLPPLEAMAAGVPVIAGNNSSMPEVCGEAAIYVSGFDAEETAMAISNVLSDEKLAGAMAKKGRARAKRFTWEKTAEAIADGLKAP